VGEPVPRTDVLLYQDEQQKVPVVDWLGGLPKNVQAKCQAYLKQLEDFGHELRRPIADYLRDGIYELRPSHQGVHYRMLYFFPKADKGRQAGPPTVVVVSNGLTKESVVPDVEIDRAIERKKKYEANPKRHTFKRASRG
jgi:Phage derived protein Gp49-like (DUF891)